MAAPLRNAIIFSCQNQGRTCINLCLSLHRFFGVNRMHQSSCMSTSNTDLYSGKSWHQWEQLRHSSVPPKAGDSSGDRQNQAAFVSSIHSPGQTGLKSFSGVTCISPAPSFLLGKMGFILTTDRGKEQRRTSRTHADRCMVCFHLCASTSAYYRKEISV